MLLKSEYNSGTYNIQDVQNQLQDYLIYEEVQKSHL